MNNKSKTIVFILGAGHSGSTLLAKALNAHSRIFSVGVIANFEEDFNKDFSLCGCATPIRECSFWDGINEKLNKRIGFGIKTSPRSFNMRKDRFSEILIGGKYGS